MGEAMAIKDWINERWEKLKEKRERIADRASKRWSPVKKEWGKPYSKPARVSKNPKAVKALRKQYRGKRYTKLMEEARGKRKPNQSIKEFKLWRKGINKRKRTRKLQWTTLMRVVSAKEMISSTMEG